MNMADVGDDDPALIEPIETCLSGAPAPYDSRLQMAPHRVRADRRRDRYRLRRSVADDRRHVRSAHLSRARRSARWAMALGCPDPALVESLQQRAGDAGGREAREAREAILRAMGDA